VTAGEETVDLARRLRAGDDGAADVLDRLHRAALVRFATRYLGDRAAAEDVAQEALVAALGADDVAPERFRAWLYRVARNRCLNVIRGRGRRPDGERLSTHADPVASLTGPLSRLFARERAADLARQLARLTEAQREVLALRYVESLSRDEAAEVLGLSVSLVKSRLHEGLKRLRNLMERDGA